MSMLRKLKLAAVILLAAVPVIWISRAIVQTGPKLFYLSAQAEDEDEDEDEEDEEDDDDDDNKPKTETVTTYVKLPDQVIKQNVVTTIYDSDGDGIFDPDDKHPQIHELLIVKDENLNGIDDAYENL